MNMRTSDYKALLSLALIIGLMAGCRDEPKSPKEPLKVTGDDTKKPGDARSDIDAQSDTDAKSDSDTRTDIINPPPGPGNECTLDEEPPVDTTGAICKAPAAPVKNPDGYPCCGRNDDCISGFCQDIWVCGKNGEYEENVTDLELHAPCLYDAQCASGRCWYGREVYRCATTCQPGDKGDGQYYCALNPYSDSTTDYICQPDPKVGKKCCQQSDCPAESLCYSQYCVTSCEYTNCPSGSKCYKDVRVANKSMDICIADELIGSLPAGAQCFNDLFCQSGHCFNQKCQDLSQVNCSGPADYPDLDQPDGYPCNFDQDCHSGKCSIENNDFVCTSGDSYQGATNLPNNVPCLMNEECASGYCWYNGGKMAADGIFDASLCAQPCMPGVAKSDGNFACQQDYFGKYLCLPVRTNNGGKGTPCLFTEFDCQEGLVCDRVEKVCKGM